MAQKYDIHQHLFLASKSSIVEEDLSLEEATKLSKQYNNSCDSYTWFTIEKQTEPEFLL